jgi:hypothetical protein
MSCDDVVDDRRVCVAFFRGQTMEQRIECQRRFVLIGWVISLTKVSCTSNVLENSDVPLSAHSLPQMLRMSRRPFLWLVVVWRGRWDVGVAFMAVLVYFVYSRSY